MTLPTSQDWTAGYVAEIGYTHGYYPELNPLQARMALLDTGLPCPTPRHACELGFGQGLSINLHAAGQAGTTWHGTDFNPAQAGFAQELARESGANAHLFDEAFAEFCRRDDLPTFDFIGLHGIWSWISDENRAVIVDFLHRKLAVGGILYVSYNTLPGWSTMAPLRHLMTQYSDRLSGAGHGITARIDAALGFVDRMLGTNPQYLGVNPTATDRFTKFKELPRSYLAHEYFNRDWHPMYFADMARWLEPAKLSFAGSAHLLDHVDAINLLPEQQQLVAGIPDAVFRQSVRDFVVNQQFRKDYWVKGARPLSPLRQAELMRAQRLVLVTPRADVPLKVPAVTGEAGLNEAIYGPVLDVMADHKVRTQGEIEAAIAGKGIAFPQLQQAVVVLAGMGHLVPAQDDAAVRAALKTTRGVNQALMQLARSQAEINHLVSPVTGGGVVVSRFAQLFALALQQGRKQPADWAAFVWQILSSQGQALMKEGKPLEGAEANLAELNVQAQGFADRQLPLLKALQVV